MLEKFVLQTLSVINNSTFQKTRVPSLLMVSRFPRETRLPEPRPESLGSRRQVGLAAGRTSPERGTTPLYSASASDPTQKTALRLEPQAGFPAQTAATIR